MGPPTIAHPTDRPNFSVVDIGSFTFWFSYQTCVAFKGPGWAMTVSENVWSRTTGKHLNQICPDKTRRIPNDEFLRRLRKATEEHNLRFRAL